MKKTILFAAFAILCLGTALPIHAKTIRKNYVVMQGGTRGIKVKSNLVKKKVSSKKISAKFNSHYMSLIVTGRKAGKSTLTYWYGKGKTKYRYTVTVLSKNKVKTLAKKKLKKYVAAIPEGTNYSYVDLNNDGVSEVFSDNGITYYNYATKKCVTKDYKIGNLYAGKNSKTLLITRPQEEIRKTEFFEYFSSLYEINPTKVFDLVDTATGYRKYTTSGLKEYGIKDANAIYSFYDDHYDQDDYDYIGYTKEELTQKLLESIPNAKEVLKTKTK